MKKVKITVLKTTLDQELAREYGAEKELFYYVHRHIARPYDSI